MTEFPSPDSFSECPSIDASEIELSSESHSQIVAVEASSQQRSLEQQQQQQQPLTQITPAEASSPEEIQQKSSSKYNSRENREESPNFPGPSSSYGAEPHNPSPFPTEQRRQIPILKRIMRNLLETIIYCLYVSDAFLCMLIGKQLMLVHFFTV